MPKKRLITEMNRLSPEAFKQADKVPLVIVLDNIRSLHNVGSVFRTCDAFRVSSLVLCGLTNTPPHPEIHKTALGAEYSMNWKYEAQTIEAVNQLKAAGYTVYAVEQAHHSLSLPAISPDPHKKYALVVGHEVKGVDQTVVDMCDGCVEIPQFGTKHSLNVSVAAGIVIWHFFCGLSAELI